VAPKVRVPAFYRRHPVTVAIFALLAVLLLLGGIRGQYWRNRVEQEFERIRAGGHPATLPDLLRYYPSVPRAQNGFAMLDDSGPVLMTTRRNFPARRDPIRITPDELNTFHSLLAGNNASLKAMWNLPEFSQGSFEPITLNNWMQQHMQSGYMAVVDADLMDTLHREGGPDLDRVRRDVFALLAHARLLRAQPLSFAQDKAEEALHRLTGSLSFLFERDLLDDETLARMQKELGRMQTTNILVRALAVQRANMIYSYRNPTAFAGMGFRVPGSVAFVENFNAALGFSDQQLIKALRLYGEALSAAVAPASERLGRLQPEIFWPTPSTVGRVFFHGSIPNLFWKDALYTTYLHMIQAGVAAKQHQRKHGELPTSIGQLVPQFFANVPVDPFTGQALRSVFTDRLIIYSVGMDQVDNTAPGSKTNAMSDLRLPVK
jgi:hypothetical protein